MSQKIKIYVWSWIRDPSVFLFSLPNEELFENAPQFAWEWKLSFIFEAFSALYRTVPDGYHIYLARRVNRFPYNTDKFIHIINFFNPEGTGVFFLANSTLLNHLTKLTGIKLE